MFRLKANVLKKAFTQNLNLLSSLKINNNNNKQSFFNYTSIKDTPEKNFNIQIHILNKTKNNNNKNNNSNLQKTQIKNSSTLIGLCKSQKSFFSKKFTKIKPSSTAQQNKNTSLKAEKEASDGDQIFIKPNTQTDKRSDKTGLNDLEKMDERQIIQYYFELRNFIMDYFRGPNFKLFYFCFHLGTSYLAINNLLQLYWLYQVFYGGSAIAVCFLNYEYYSSAKEKRFIDRVSLIW